jgi:hypothetical protein
MKTILGDACAHCPRADGTTSYPRIGLAFSEPDRDNPDALRISIKLDTLPIPSTGWSGWVNIFPRKESHD